MTDEHSVLIVGGGVAALEAALALRDLAGDRVRVTLLAPDRHFTYRPLSVGEPFGLGHPTRYELAAIAKDRGFAVVRDALASVDADAHEVVTQDDQTIDLRPPPARARRPAAARDRRRADVPRAPGRAAHRRRPARAGHAQPRPVRGAADAHVDAAGLRAGADDRELAPAPRAAAGADDRDARDAPAGGLRQRGQRGGRGAARPGGHRVPRRRRAARRGRRRARARRRREPAGRPRRRGASPPRNAMPAWASSVATSALAALPKTSSGRVSGVTIVGSSRCSRRRRQFAVISASS